MSRNQIRDAFQAPRLRAGRPVRSEAKNNIAPPGGRTPFRPNGGGRIQRLPSGLQLARPGWGFGSLEAGLHRRSRRTRACPRRGESQADVRDGFWRRVGPSLRCGDARGPECLAREAAKSQHASRREACRRHLPLRTIHDAHVQACHPRR